MFQLWTLVGVQKSLSSEILIPIKLFENVEATYEN